MHRPMDRVAIFYSSKRCEVPHLSSWNQSQWSKVLFCYDLRCRILYLMMEAAQLSYLVDSGQFSCLMEAAQFPCRICKANHAEPY